jgi:hypothetical protein
MEKNRIVETLVPVINFPKVFELKKSLDPGF